MRFFSTVYLILLLYTIAALMFWGVSLQKQNTRILEQEVLILRSTVDSVQHPALYNTRMQLLQNKYEMRVKQYYGEGSTFLLVILIGAAVVWSSFRKSIHLSRQKNNFMLSVTHELKSPIAAIKLNLQTLEKHQLDAAKRSSLIERCIKEANRLNDLCNNMLFASQIEGRQYVASKEIINFSELVEDAVRDYAQRYPRPFEEDINVDCKLNGDRVMLGLAINNLLENAVKYSPPDKPIVVELTEKNNCILLCVKDEGAGIPNDEKKKIFDKFYRVGNEGSRKSKGTGLGLYLTCKIIGQHKGKITVKDNLPHGSNFEVSLPMS
ncbi:MAG: HAMP domain-containing histidine kinase [Taibaiella sp.]|nr:HAMP domain-containing histidine kinase [Taibaiella sp.]